MRKLSNQYIAGFIDDEGHIKIALAMLKIYELPFKEKRIKSEVSNCFGVFFKRNFVIYKKLTELFKRLKKLNKRGIVKVLNGKQRRNPDEGISLVGQWEVDLQEKLK
jgi:hypothetical protein